MTRPCATIILSSDAFGHIAATLRRLDRWGHDVAEVVLRTHMEPSFVGRLGSPSCLDSDDSELLLRRSDANARARAGLATV